MKRIPFLVACLTSLTLGVVSSSARADEAAENGPLRVDEVLRSVDKTHPSVVASRRQLDVARGERTSADGGFDTSFRNLTVLRKVTEAFPEDGVVTAKTLEIRDVSAVSCSGTASDNQSLLRMLEQLRASKDVRDLKVDNIRGKTPLQFTFNFHWCEGGGDGN